MSETKNTHVPNRMYLCPFPRSRNNLVCANKSSNKYTQLSSSDVNLASHYYTIVVKSSVYERAAGSYIPVTLLETDHEYVREPLQSAGVHEARSTKQLQCETFQLCFSQKLSEIKSNVFKMSHA